MSDQLESTINDICKIIEYRGIEGDYLGVIINVSLGEYICCFLKKFAYKSWKVQTFSDKTLFLVRNITPLQIKLTPLFKDKHVKISELRYFTDKMLRKITWIDDNQSIRIDDNLINFSNFKPIMKTYEKKKSKDVRGKYDEETKIYNDIYGKHLSSLFGGSIADIKALILDTAKTYTCNVLNKIGVVPTNIVVPNNSIDEYKSLRDSFLCTASYEDFAVCLERYITQGIKFHTIFLDNGGWINTQETKSFEKKKSQDTLIRYIFDTDSLQDECIFALTTSLRRFTDEKNDQYKLASHKFITTYAELKKYRLMNYIIMPYGKRTFFQLYHLKRE